jgi:hypothetical protein
MKKVIPAIALLLSINTFACVDHSLLQPDSALQVLNTSVSTASVQGPMLVTVIGELKNTTANKIDSLILEAKMTDASGKVIDVLSESVYGLVVPPGEQVSFRLQGAAATTSAKYANAQVRVVSAEAHPMASAQPSPSLFNRLTEIAISWGPMILLLLVWVFLARKYSGKGSTQDKMLKALVEQNALLTQQVAAIGAISTALGASKQADGIDPNGSSGLRT